LSPFPKKNTHQNNEEKENKKNGIIANKKTNELLAHLK
jgi:hypothetical protein